MNTAFRAMTFARQAHAGQVRKYTGVPYDTHLAEVAGIVASVAGMAYHGYAVTETIEQMIAVAWLHDCVEDCGVELETIGGAFGTQVARGVKLLSDLETGNRAERKAASCARLANAPGWVQTIKCADLISNTASIVQHDPKFAITYLAEKRALLEVMTQADRRLWTMARDLAEAV